MLDKVVYNENFDENKVGAFSAGALFLMKWVRNVHKMDVNLIRNEI